MQFYVWVWRLHRYCQHTIKHAHWRKSNEITIYADIVSLQNNQLSNKYYISLILGKRHVPHASLNLCLNLEDGKMFSCRTGNYVPMYSYVKCYCSVMLVRALKILIAYLLFTMLMIHSEWWIIVACNTVRGVWTSCRWRPHREGESATESWPRGKRNCGSRQSKFCIALSAVRDRIYLYCIRHRGCRFDFRLSTVTMGKLFALIVPLSLSIMTSTGIYFIVYLS